MARLGDQRPTFERVGGYSYTDGDEAVSVFRSYGFDFDAAQLYQMRLYLAKNDDGDPASIQISISVPRQNGKSYAARWYAVWCSAVCGLEVIYSAHNGDTVDEFFRMLCHVFEDGDYPDFADMLACAPYKQPGRQVLTFRSGGRIRFNTRTNNKIRGGTVSVIVVDEAQELTEAQLNALLPASSASPGGPPQQIYIGTPPDPTCLGTVFQRLHDEAHGDGGCDDSWWLEWAAEELPPEDARAEDLLDLAYATNPALGTRITERAVRNEIRTMTRDGFARERLGWWKPGGSIERAIPFEKWKECEIPDDAAPQGVPSFGVKFSADGRHVALSAAIVKPDGGSFVELVSYASTSGGIGRLVDFVVERADSCGSVAVDGRSGSSAFLDSAVKRGFPKRFATECSTANAIAAASMLLEEVESKTLEHIESPALDESATGSIRRKIGNAGGFGFGDGPDSVATPVESAAIALWAARTAKRDPSRTQEIW